MIRSTFRFALLALPFFVTSLHAQQAPVFSQIVVFGDSLSDDGNIRHRTQSDFGVSYPGGSFNYSDGRFTNSSDTTPGSTMYVGVWHEELARTFLSLPVATNSLDGGLDFAFGGATTIDGQSQRTVISNPAPFSGGNVSITIDNVGKQVNDYLSNHTPDPNALYIVWGGSNDLFDDDSEADVSATLARVVGLVNRLATAGARNFLVPNVAPLGVVPEYSSDTTKSPALNTAAYSYRLQFMTAFDSTIQSYASQGVTLNIYPVDIWLNTMRILISPTDFGFTNVTNSAQGRSMPSADPFLFWDDLHPTTAGHFQIAKEADRALSGQVSPVGRALNLSTRVNVGTDASVAIGGFIITGTVPKRVIIRAIGPSLSTQGVPGVLADPTLQLLDSTQTVLSTNDDWRDSQEMEIQGTQLAPTNDKESAIVATLQPGNYTAVMAGKGNTTGVGLVEIYDLDSSTTDSALGNISTRGFVGTGDNAMIGGFIVGAGENPVVVIRALGPSLTSSTITNALADPTMELHDADGTTIATNDNWEDTQSEPLKASTLPPTNASEAAMVVALAPGNYTAVVRGKGDATGVALVEAYRIP